MAIHPETKALLDELASTGARPWSKMTPAEARENWHTLCKRFSDKQESIVSIEDHLIPSKNGEMLLRCYTPKGRGPFPALVYLHGGGWVVGTTETYSSSNRALANATGTKVFFPTYRMAPEHKYPAAVEDCYTAVNWIAENAASIDVNPKKIAVGGDSAGGNLSAAVALMARDRGGPNLAFQILLYPVTNHNFETNSYKEFATGFLLETADMRWFWNHYLPNEEAGKEPYASPLQVTNLDGLPPALVVTAEYDVLRDEGEAYAQKLQTGGISVQLSRHDGSIHGFMHPFSERLPFAKDGLEEIRTALKQAFA